MKTFYEADIRRRVKVLTFILAGWGAIVALRLFQVQDLGHRRAKAAVLEQAQDVVTIEPRRGNIVDRNFLPLHLVRHACKGLAPEVSRDELPSGLFSPGIPLRIGHGTTLPRCE